MFLGTIGAAEGPPSPRLAGQGAAWSLAGASPPGALPLDALVAFDEVFPGEDLLEVGAEGIGEGLFVDDAAAIEAFVLLFGEILADAGGQVDVLPFDHGAELLVFFGVDVPKDVQGEAVAEAVGHMQDDAEPGGEGMDDAHVPGGHAADVGGDHHLFAVFFAHHVVGEENFLAELHGAYGEGVDDGVAVAALKRFDAVHEGIDAGVEILVAGNGGEQVGIEQELIIDRVVAVHAQFEIFGDVGKDTGAGALGARAGKGRDADLVDGGILDEFPSLIVFGLAGVGEQVGDGLGGVEGVPSADAHDAAGSAAVGGGYGFLEGVDAGDFRLGTGVDEMELVALFHGQTADQFMIAEEVVDEIDDRTVHGFAAGFQQVAELSQRSPPEHIVRNVFCIAIHGKSLIG